MTDRYRWCGDCGAAAYWHEDVPGYFHVRDKDQRPPCRWADGMIPNAAVRWHGQPEGECGYEWRGLFARLSRHTHRCGRNFAHDADAHRALHVCGQCASTHMTKGDIEASVRQAYDLPDQRDR